MLNINIVMKNFFCGHLNSLEVAAADVGNSYINGFTKDKIYTVAMPQFGEWGGQVLIFIRSICGLNIYR